MSGNAHLFFEHELPAFQGYLLGEEDFAGMDRPILYVVSDSETGYGTAHHDRMELVDSWLLQTETLVVPDADHALTGEPASRGALASSRSPAEAGCYDPCSAW